MPSKGVEGVFGGEQTSRVWGLHVYTCAIGSNLIPVVENSQLIGNGSSMSKAKGHASLFFIFTQHTVWTTDSLV